MSAFFTTYCAPRDLKARVVLTVSLCSVCVDKLTVETWIFALLSAVLVGACGVFPLLVNRWVQLDVGCRDSLALKAVLSFAVGGLLGDVFLHLMPEAWGSTSGELSLGLGLWVLTGFFSFLLVEKAAMCTEVQETGKHCPHKLKTDGVSYMNGSCSTGVALHTADQCTSVDKRLKSLWVGKDISGYLNLVANCTDNFTHGLAIAASYVASPAVGLLTTLAILCHEIPHEIGDFAILLNSGFSCKGAAKAQMATACWGVLGVLAGLTAEHISSSTSWLLPFTAGGFLYIALVSIVPGLLEDSSVCQSVTQLLAVGVGVAVMALVTIVEKKSCAYMPPLSATIQDHFSSA